MKPQIGKERLCASKDPAQDVLAVETGGLEMDSGNSVPRGIMELGREIEGSRGHRGHRRPLFCNSSAIDYAMENGESK
jgi:hypothetical protein